MDSTRPKRWNIARLVLVVSLALNLAVAGVVGGALFSGRFGDGPPRQFDLGLGPVVRALNPQERREIGEGLRRDRSLRGMNMRQQKEALLSALRSEPFDPDALALLLANQTRENQRLQSRAQEAFVALVTAMTPERRAAFAAQLDNDLLGRPRGN